MGQVVKLRLVRGVGSSAKVAANKVLSGARGQLREVVVVGYTHEGDLYAASSGGPGDAVWLLEAAKLWLLQGCPSD